MISDLPRGLESEILSRVPATSLKQLRFTCKRWYTLSKDQSFIKKNSGRSATQMVLKKEESVYSFSIDLHGIHDRYDQFIEFTGKLESLKNSEDVKISRIFHCEGLLLCTTEDNTLVVWNPCTGQTRWIQSITYSRMHHACFLGYENNNKSCDSYKILSFGYHRSATVNKFEIYEFHSDSWRVLDAADTHDGFDYIFEVGVSLKGNTYWLDVEKADPLANCIVKFDFTTERFGCLPLPFHSCFINEFAVISVVREEKLALLYQLIVDEVDLKMRIWLTNTKTDEANGLSWSEFLVLDVGKYLIYGITRVMSFLVDEENEKVMCCDVDFEDEERVRIYIVGKDIHINKQVYKEVPTGEFFCSPLLVSYVPSLVQIPARQSKPGRKRKR